MHISITGDLGSGKSTVAKEICSILNMEYLSTGSIQRKLATDMGMNTLEFNKYTDNNKEIDDYIDQQLKNINDVEKPHVLDSRLGWHFVNKSFKIYLMAIDEVAAARVLADGKRIGEPKSADLSEKIRDQKARRKSENDRFEKTYGVRPNIYKDFDAIIDTSRASVEEVTNLIITLYHLYSNKKNYNKIWKSPQAIYPSRIINFDDVYTTYDKSTPIICTLIKEEFFIVDGHRHLSASIKTNHSIVPCELVENTYGIKPDMDLIHQWEEKHGFRFYHYV